MIFRRVLSSFLACLTGSLLGVNGQASGEVDAEICQDLRACTAWLLKVNSSKERLKGGRGLTEIIPNISSAAEAKSACAERGLEVPEIWELALAYNPDGVSRESRPGSVFVETDSGGFHYSVPLFDPLLNSDVPYRLWSSTSTSSPWKGELQLETGRGDIIHFRARPTWEIPRAVRCRMGASHPSLPLICNSLEECESHTAKAYQRIHELTGAPRLTGTVVGRLPDRESARKVCSSLGLRLPTIQELATALNPSGASHVPLAGYRRIQPSGESPFHYKDDMGPPVGLPRGVEFLWSSSSQDASESLAYVFGWNYGIFVQNEALGDDLSAVKCVR